MKSNIFYNKWLEAKEKIKINDYIDEKEMCFFFLYNNEIYGTDEENRLIFAKIKNPDDDDKNFIDEYRFKATNLSKLKKTGEITENLFSVDDVKKIKVISQEEAENGI